MRTEIHDVADHIKEKECKFEFHLWTVHYVVYIVRQIKLSVKIHKIKLHSKKMILIFDKLSK